MTNQYSAGGENCTVVTSMYFGIQLFRERLSFKRGNAYATISKVIMCNGGFTVAWLKIKVFERDRRKQHKHVYSCFFLHSY